MRFAKSARGVLFTAIFIAAAILGVYAAGVARLALTNGVSLLLLDDGVSHLLLNSSQAQTYGQALWGLQQPAPGQQPLTTASLVISDATGANVPVGTVNNQTHVFTPAAGAITAYSQYFPSNPPTTTSTVGVMMGLNAAFAPSMTGRALIIVSGTYNSTLAVGQSVTAGIRFGAGPAPANGAAITGQGTGLGIQMPSCAATICNAWTRQAILVGLTPGISYWLDLSWQNSSNAAATGPTSLTITVIEF
jgi:hypothetical protein